ncbi:hypothetical protein [Aquisalibacillus elongatus]|uniref:Uncharacterized protein n=1 Tax=Aquisalibacillus elongatus TaxID=485577 RepID=A0A3N5AZJ7_9BACI|nr:hypothetical protein [Aquisalibacillus elongatus]RPF50383.1 hypothetical protein EDC24_2821 [Aquisalibacillus elongatus]
MKFPQNKEHVLGIYLLWVVILVIELLWLLSSTKSPHGNDDLLIGFSVIVVTIAVGVVGINLAEKWRK